MSDDPKNLRETKTGVGEGKAQPSQRRRRLVKGALSAPVFLTLQNGSVFANTSNDAEVVTNLTDAGDNPVCVFSYPTDPVFEGDKVDFGTDPMCFEPTEITSENGLLRCKAGDDLTGGYIVAGSSGASIC